MAIPQDPDTVTEGGPKGPNGSAVDVSPSAVYDNGTSFMGTIVLSQDMFGGYNKTIVQYANNGLAHNMVDMGGGWYDSWNDADSASGFRIMNTGEIPVTDDFRFTHALTYGYASDIGATVDDEDLISAVARVTIKPLSTPASWLNSVPSHRLLTTPTVLIGKLLARSTP